MGIHLEVLNFDNEFSMLKIPPVIVNDISCVTAEDKAKLNKNIFTTYSSDLLSNVPTCDCGKITGEYNVGIICQECNSEVKNPVGDLESFVWLRAPVGVKALINPCIWNMLTKHFNKSGFNLIRYLADASYRSDSKTPAFLPQVESFGFQRGLNYFVENFDTIMDALFSMTVFKQQNAESNIEKLIKDPLTRSCVFSQYVPLPNKTLLVVEENNSGTFIDPVLTGGIDAIKTLVGIDTAINDHSVRVKENRTIKCIDTLGTFYMDYYKTTFAKKEGIFRKHIFGTRSHFSFRAVISSITEPHNYDEIYIPWKVAVNCLEIHLTNKLLKLGMTPNQIQGFLYEHATKYSPLLDSLFQELINESPSGGLDCVLIRNPSLMRGSAIALKIVKVRTDVQIPTIGLSINAVKSLNAD